MTLLDGPRSGDLVRARRRHHFQQDLQNADCILIQGSAHGRGPPGRLPLGDEGARARREDHPRRPALLAHERDGRPPRADPRRARDIAFLGGLIHHVLETGVLLPRLRRSTTRTPRRSSTRTSATPRTSAGCSAASTRRPASTTARPGCYEGGDSRRRPATREHTRPGVHREHGGACGPARRAIRRSSTRAASSSCSSATTPATRRRWSSASAASRREQFLRGRRDADRQLGPRAHHGALLRASAGRSTRPACRSSAPARSCSCCSATSGRPGGGIMAMRGHASIQGSTDIPTLYDLLPGYLPMPQARRTSSDARGLRREQRRASAAGGRTSTKYIVSLLKAWFGDAATRGERLRLRAPAEDHRQPLALPDDAARARRRARRPVRDGPEPGGRLAALGAAAARAGAS